MCSYEEYAYFKGELEKIISFLQYNGPLFIRLPTRIDTDLGNPESVSLLSSL